MSTPPIPHLCSWVCLDEYTTPIGVDHKTTEDGGFHPFLFGRVKIYHCQDKTCTLRRMVLTDDLDNTEEIAYVRR